MKLTNEELSVLFGIRCQVVEGYMTAAAYTGLSGVKNAVTPCRWLAVTSDGKWPISVERGTGTSLTRGDIVYGSLERGTWKEDQDGFLQFDPGLEQGEKGVPIFVANRDGCTGKWTINEHKDACCLWRDPRPGETELKLLIKLDGINYWAELNGLDIYICKDILGRNTIAALPDGTFTVGCFMEKDEATIRELIEKKKAENNR